MYKREGKKDAQQFYLISSILRKRHRKVNFLATPSANNQIKWNKNNYNSSLELDEKALPFQDLHFDKILISHWFEVSSRLDLVIEELRRILKGQGKLILIIPNATPSWSRSTAKSPLDSILEQASEISKVIGIGHTFPSTKRFSINTEL